MSHVKEGYKQTKVGVIPEDWTVCSINDLIENGLIYKPLDGNHGDIHPKSKDFIENGIPFIMANNLNGSQIDLQNCKFISKIQADKLQKGFSKEGDILLSHKGTVGEVAIVPNLATEYIMLTPQVTYYRVKDKNKIYNIYIKHYLSGFLFQNFINNIATGGTRAYISITEQRKLPFILPPIKEQQKIANILSTWDSAISKQEELITQKEKLKKGLMQKLLSGEVRFGGFEDEWKKFEFELIFNRVASKKYQINSSQYLENGKYPVIDQGKKKIIAYSNNEEKLFKNKNIIIFGDHTREIKYIDFDFIVGADGTQLINTKDNFDIKFFYYQLLNSKIPNTGYNRHFKFLKEMVFKVPSIEEQQKIAKVLTLADKEIELLKNELEQLKTQKKGLMQKLLTGEVRVKL